MKSIMLGWAFAAGLACFGAVEQAAAQYYFPQQTNPLYRPPVSPYVTLGRGGSAAANYYGIVRPQLEFARQLQMLQIQQQQMVYMPQLGVPTEEDLVMGTYSVSGHPTMFFN